MEQVHSVIDNRPLVKRVNELVFNYFLLDRFPFKVKGFV